MCEKDRWAIQTGDLEEVKARFKTAEDVNKCLDGNRPLHIAADYGHMEVLDFLISTGADVNAVNKHGFTPLQLACFEDHYNCVKFLLEKGADKTIKTPDGKYAHESISNEAIQALLK